MGFLSASASFTRYLPTSDVPENLWRELPDLLKKFAFRDIDHTADERSFGWSCFDDWLDTEWKAAPPEKGHYVAWFLRLETRRVPPAVFKKHVEIALREYKAAIKDDEKRFVSKARKKEIKEQVELRLRARMLPIPAVFDVVWDMRTRVVYFGSTNAKACQLFQDYFKDTFDLELEPQTPFHLAGRMLGEEAVSRLENLEASSFTG